MSEKRSHSRIKVNWPVQINTGNRSIEGIAKNVTLKGVFICCLDALSMKKNVSISIFPPNYKPINIVGKAVWSDSYALDEENAPACMGLSFVELSDENRHLLKEIIEVSIE